MRHLFFVAIALILSACDYNFSLTQPTSVDPKTLPPLTGREQALLTAASVAVAQGNHSAAERDYLSAIAASTGHVESHLALARLYEKQKNLPKEREILNQALALQPHHAEVNYLLGKLEITESRYQAASDAFAQGLKSTPGNLDLLNGAGIASDMLGQHTQAKNNYQLAITMNQGSNLSGVKSNWGMSYLLSGDAKRAVEILYPESKKAGASPTTRHNLALAYGILGKTREARAAIRDEMDEETRLLAIAKLKEYWRDRTPGKNPLRLQPQ